MTTFTGTITVNTAFLREIKEENQHLCDILCALRRLMVSPAAMKNHERRLVELLDALCDQLALHFSLEEAYGYFEDAVDVAPRLSERAEILRDGHSALFDAIRDLAGAAHDAHLRRQMSHCMPAIVERFHQFDGDLQRHEAEENELILESAHLDIGVGD